VDWNITNHNAYTITPYYTLNNDYGGALFTEKVDGRYEWGVVGTQAASVDSAGLAMITAAFKDKEVEYGISGEDIFDTTLANNIPWVMSRMRSSASTTKADYYYSSSPVTSADWRTALRDDHCTTWQIAAADLIGSGGPFANLLAWYDNDFESAFYGLSQFTSYATWANKIVPLTCWNGTKKAYADTNNTGYAVLTTYEDINGTNIFMVWGNWGRDTYYASQWFWQDGIMEFQSPAFIGATGVVLKINYDSNNKPGNYTVQEILGTISETTTFNPYGSLDGSLTAYLKGGIHDP